MNNFFGTATIDRPPRPADEPVGELELVHTFDDGPMPTGVAVSHAGRIFINFPKWGDDVRATVVELKHGHPVPYPDDDWNSPRGIDDERAFVSVQSVIIDAKDRLWVLDTGSPEFEQTRLGGPKLVCVDLATDAVVKVIAFPSDVVLPTSYLNDLRVDLRKHVVYITDSSDTGPNGIIVVDLDNGESWRRLHNHFTTQALTPPEFVPVVEGRVFMERDPDGTTRPVTMGSDGIALSADGTRLWYCPLASRHWYSVSTEQLRNRESPDDQVGETVVDEGEKGGASDGLETDDLGRFYATNYEHNAIIRRMPDGELQTLVHDARMLWPDTMAVAKDGYLYFTANQLHRQAKYQGGDDLRVYPYALFRVRIDAGPVLLR